jgi:hypothetical protein
MNQLQPQTVRLTGPEGFIEGVVLPFAEQESGWVSIYISKSDLYEPGKIVNVSTNVFTLDTKPSITNVPNGAHVITDSDGETRLARMDQREYDSWKNGDTTTTYGLMVKAKRDFGDGFYDAKTRTNIREGWNVVYTLGKYKGCQAMPGGAWSHTQEGAINMIMAFIAAGGNENSDVENDARFGARFHALVRLNRSN